MGVVNNITAAEVSLLANTSSVGLVLSDLLSKNGGKIVLSFCFYICILTSMLDKFDEVFYTDWS